MTSKTMAETEEAIKTTMFAPKTAIDLIRNHLYEKEFHTTGCFFEMMNKNKEDICNSSYQIEDIEQKIIFFKFFIDEIDKLLLDCKTNQDLYIKEIGFKPKKSKEKCYVYPLYKKIHEDDGSVIDSLLLGCYYVNEKRFKETRDCFEKEMNFYSKLLNKTDPSRSINYIKPEQIMNINIEKLTWKKDRKDLAYLIDELIRNGFIAENKNINKLIAQHFSYNDFEIKPTEIADLKSKIKNITYPLNPSKEIEEIITKAKNRYSKEKKQN